MLKWNEVRKFDHFKTDIKLIFFIQNRAISMTWVVLCHSFLYTPGKASLINRWVYDVRSLIINELKLKRIHHIVHYVDTKG